MIIVAGITLSHAQDWLLFEDNIGENLSIDENLSKQWTSLYFSDQQGGKGHEKGLWVAVG